MNVINNYIIGVIRTFVPILVGAVITWLTLHGYDPHLSKTMLEALSAGLTAGFTGAYYVIVHFLEVKVAPHFGWLLGWAKAPTYIGKVGTPPQS